MATEPSADLATLTAEIDEAHLRFRVAYRTRDLATYVACFAPDLVYRDARGRPAVAGLPPGPVYLAPEPPRMGPCYS